jgi:hypothetical protein
MIPGFVVAMVTSIRGTSGFPFTSIVLGMRQYMPNQQREVVMMNLRDEAVFVPSNVEHNELADQVGAGERGPHLVERCPFDLASDPVPGIER